MTLCSYQSEKELFNFDYKKDLKNHVTARDRVYKTRKMAELPENSDEEEFGLKALQDVKESDVAESVNNNKRNQPPANKAKNM